MWSSCRSAERRGGAAVRRRGQPPVADQSGGQTDTAKSAVKLSYQSTNI
jgi:hypothetical protein